jgi:hypothetical protein
VPHISQSNYISSAAIPRTKQTPPPLAMLSTFLSLGSIPFLFYTSPHSWSTSLNLLFFYLTWTTLLLSHPPLHIEILGTLAVRLLFFLLPSLLLAVFDFTIPSLSNPLKIRPSKSKPRKKSKKRGEKGERRSKRNMAEAVVEDITGAVQKKIKKGKTDLGWRVYVWSFLNGVVMPGLVLAAVEAGTTELVGGKRLLRVARTLPLPAEIAWDIVKAGLVREVCFVHPRGLKQD